MSNKGQMLQDPLRSLIRLSRLIDRLSVSREPAGVRVGRMIPDAPTHDA